MLKRIAVVLLLLGLVTGFVFSQNIAEDATNAPRPVKLVPPAPPGPVFIHCGSLFDGKVISFGRA